MAPNCPGPRVEVPGPRIRPSRFGLFSVAEVETVSDGTWEWGIQYQSQGCDSNVYTWPKPCLPDKLPVQPVTITVDLTTAAPEWDDTERYACSPPPDQQDYRWLSAASTADPCWALPPGTRVQVSANGGPLTDVVAESRVVAAISAECPTRVLVREAGSGKEEYVDLAPGQESAQVVFELSADPEVWLRERRKVMDGPPGWVCGDPFWIYSSASCMPGAEFAKDAEPMARRRMESGEQCAVESWLWRYMRESHPIPVFGECSGSIGRAPDHASDRLEACLSNLEAALTRSLGGIGVLHVPSRIAMRLASRGSIWTDLAGWYTPLGTPVAFGTCYDGSLGPVDHGRVPEEVVMYGTGPVTIRRGPINTYEGFDRITNDFAAIAERAYAVTTDCALFYTACPNDWCLPPAGDTEPNQQDVPV